MKGGATGNLPPHVFFEAMTTAFATFLKLSQARGEPPLTTPELMIRSTCYFDSRRPRRMNLPSKKRDAGSRGGEKGGRPPQVFLAMNVSAVKPALVKPWEAENQATCDFLSSHVFDRDQLRSSNNNNNNAAALRKSARI